MKRVFIFAALMLLSCAVFAQDPLDADTIIYQTNIDGSYNILAAKIYPQVTAENKVRFEKERIKRQLNQLADLERRIVETRKQVQLDSAKLSATDVSAAFPDSSLLASFEGKWTLVIGEAQDKLNVEKDGSFTSDNSGDGKIIIAAENGRKIFIELGGKRLGLLKISADVYENDKQAVRLSRSVDALSKPKKNR